MTKKTLPKTTKPLFPITLPVTGTKTTYRCFSVREEKILLMAKETNDIEQIITSLKQVMNNCVNGIDAAKLPLADIEYAMLKMRSSSINNVIEFSIKDPETFEEISLSIDLADVKVFKEEDHSNTIKVSDEMYIKMRYPTIDEFGVLLSSTKETSKHYDIMVSCIEKIVNGEEVYETSDFSREEIDEFMDGLDERDIGNIKKFFDTMPRLRHEVKYKNSNGKDQTFVIEGLQTFFV